MFRSTLIDQSGPLVRTLALGGLGGAAFHFVGLPAGWLSGAMVLVAAATLGGVRTVMPDRLRDGLFVVIGLSMGGGVRPDVVERIGEWPLSMAILALVVVGVTAASYAVLHLGAKWSSETAYFGSIPGALSFVIALASERGADLPRIASSQSLRLLILVAVLPTVVVHSTASAPEAGAATTMPDLVQLALGLIMCASASWLAVRVRLPGGWMTGAFFLSAALNATGAMSLTVPDAILVPCFVGTGAMIGCRFNSMTLASFVRLLGASLLAFLAGFAVSVGGAAIVATLLHIPFGQALLAYAPGGLEVMTLLSFVLGLDPAFVAAHQIARYVVMVLTLPFMTLFLFGRQKN